MIVTIGGTYAPFCMRMASLFFKIKAQDHKLNIVVVVKNKTNHPISSNSHHSATAKKQYSDSK